MTDTVKKNKSANNVNVLTYYENEDNTITCFEENVNDISSREDYSYYGWICWSGIQSLFINAEGEIFNANCMAKKLGNVSIGFELSTKPIICSKSKCVCCNDLQITKIKNEKYKHLVRSKERLIDD